MKSNEKVKDIVFQISAILILFAAVFFSVNPAVAPYILAIGVAGFGAVTFTRPYPGKSIRGKRLFNIQILAVVLMAVAAFLMFRNMGEWIYALLVSAILTLYCSIVLPRVYKNEEQDDNKA